MNLNFDVNFAQTYSNPSQIARKLTEKWVKENSFCPNCGNDSLFEFENNRPVADFYCNNCNEEYELKSKKGSKVGKKITDGAYSSMIERIASTNNPNFFFLNYTESGWSVNNFLVIPKYFFVPDIIEKRNPLSPTARRAGWIGCNIDLTKIPESGRIFLVKDSQVISHDKVEEKWKSTAFLRSRSLESKGWIIDVMACIDKIANTQFTLNEMYSFEGLLKAKYPNNNHIKDKIRQQLQTLRDKGLIEFTGNGNYKKVLQ